MEKTVTSVEKLSFLTGIFLAMFGEWEYAMGVLIGFQVLDMVLGTANAFVGRSHKSEQGYIQSGALLKGLVRKIAMLTLVAIGNQLDILLQLDVIRIMTLYSLITYELTSILEHMVDMSVPLPKVITNALEYMKQKEGDDLDRWQ